MKMIGDVIRGRSLYLSFQMLSFGGGCQNAISNFGKKDSQTTQRKF